MDITREIYGEAKFKGFFKGLNASYLGLCETALQFTLYTFTILFFRWIDMSIWRDVVIHSTNSKERTLPNGEYGMILFCYE